MKKLTEQELIDRVRVLYEDVIRYVCGFRGVRTKCLFVDEEYGEWLALPDALLHGKGKHPARASKDRKKACEKSANRVSADDINKRLEESGHFSRMVCSSYSTTTSIATFVDAEYGEWKCTPHQVLGRGIDHPTRAKIKTKLTKQKQGMAYTAKGINDLLSTRHCKLVEEKYTGNVRDKCWFVDEEYGEWLANVSSVIRGQDHPKRKKEKTKRTYQNRYGVSSHMLVKEISDKHKETMIKRHGVDNGMKSKEVSLKAARKLAITSIKYHWSTGEELVCQGSWEAKVVDWLNLNQTNYQWQPKTFTLSDGKTYRPDLYLVDSNIWIEVKGYFRDDAKKKWDEFCETHPNAELWNKEKLKKLEIL